MSYKKIMKYLDVIRKSCDLVEQELENMVEGKMMPDPEPVVVVEQPKFDRAAYVEDILNVKDWPEAVPPHLLASDTSQQDQIERANFVLNMMLDSDIKGGHFLDFGCGDGWIAREALPRQAASSTGYDINKSDVWKKINGPTFTTNFGDLKRGHYNHIMVYDVLDHAQNPEEVMVQVRSLLAKEGRVYVRCHPWTSRHASHLFKNNLNKAYIHLFLTWEEIYEAVGKVQPMYTRVEKNPIEAYHWWFHMFKIVSEKKIQEPVHPFFLQDNYKTILQREQGLKAEEVGQFLTNMTNQFIDYVLVAK